jgi:hypothetical protein
MSVSNHRHFLTSADLTMLDTILINAGFRGTEAEVDAESTGDAARFLTSLFQSGVTTEPELTAALNTRGASVGLGDSTPVQVKVEALDRWRDEGGS